jgi:cullin 1
MASTSAAAADVLTKPPSRTADLEETWNFLNIGVDHIMNNLEAGLSFANYTNLYTCVYNYCTSTKMQNNKTDGNRSKSPSYSFFL